MRLPRFTLLLIGLALRGAAAVSAQDLPPYVPANPLLESRSALYAQPFLSPHPGWGVRLLTDYYNAVEVAQSADARQTVFDAEVLQTDLWITRDVSRRVFVIANLALRGGYDGFLDGFLIWYHHATGLEVPARDELPHNQFRWTFALPGAPVVRPRPGTFLGDFRTGAGWRLSGRVQLIGSITLPTATLGIDGWTRHQVGSSLAATAQLLRSSRLTIDASGSAGYTPTSGPLAAFQRSTFGSGLLSARWRFAGRQAVFATYWDQSSNWKDTGFHTFDYPERTLDFGFLLQPSHHGPELQLGMTQDIVPKGPSLDVGFTVGIRW
jgi:hypothetical protein